MEIAKSRSVTYPEGLNETKIDALLQSMLDGINRSHLDNNISQTRVRHCLLEERMGKDVWLNMEISRLIKGIVRSLSLSPRYNNNPDDIHAGLSVSVGWHLEKLLVDTANDSAKLQADLTDFKSALTQLIASNPEDDSRDVQELVNRQLQQKLTMPTTVQENVLYPPVEVQCWGGSKESVLETLENCRSSLLQTLKGKDDDDSRSLREAVEAETAAVKAWFEKNYTRQEVGVKITEYKFP